ncbi:MAG: hypothetical protein NVS4B11_00460 [Ktedonobacteraceae bacterium]
MTSDIKAPQLRKGSLIATDPETKQMMEIAFQYNPDTLTRSLTAQSVTSDFDRNEAYRLKAPPKETISLDIELDVTDAWEKGEDSDVIKDGLYPILSALELLLYPKSDTVISNEKLARQGIIEIIPLEAPSVQFVWGPNRTLPVLVTSFNITEEAFDPKLNPIRAKVSLQLQVLNYYDLGYRSPGGKQFMTHHTKKEGLARQNHPKSLLP